MVFVTNENAGSDGDIVNAAAQALGIGPVVGVRTWGGVVGISDSGPLLDGGTVFVPQSGTNAPTGEWIIEGEGVTPDIEVENDPASLRDGHDLQLERGVQEVMKAVEAKGMKLPAKPADPVKVR